MQVYAQNEKTFYLSRVRVGGRQKLVVIKMIITTHLSLVCVGNIRF